MSFILFRRCVRDFRDVWAWKHREEDRCPCGQNHQHSVAHAQGYVQPKDGVHALNLQLVNQLPMYLVLYEGENVAHLPSVVFPLQIFLHLEDPRLDEAALAEDLEAGRRLQGREEDVRHLGAAAAPAPRQADGEGDAGLQVGDVGQRAVALQQQ